MFSHCVVTETDASRVLPEFGEVEISSLPDGTTFEDIKSLQSLYREHCEVFPIIPTDLFFGSFYRFVISSEWESVQDSNVRYVAVILLTSGYFAYFIGRDTILLILLEYSLGKTLLGGLPSSGQKYILKNNILENIVICMYSEFFQEARLKIVCADLWLSQ